MKKKQIKHVPFLQVMQKELILPKDIVEKKCSKCKKDKPIEDFSRTGLIVSSQCKQCVKEKAIEKAEQKKLENLFYE